MSDAPQSKQGRKRKLIVVIDGTGNTATTAKRNGFSNAFRVANSLRTGEADQIIFYFPGPGTRQTPFSWLNRMTGAETTQIVTEAYLTLCSNIVDPVNDELYLFGFSRGAVAVKILAHIISMFGIIEPEEFEKSKHIWNGYYNSSTAEQSFFINKTKVLPIKFVGTFDAVHGPKRFFWNMPVPNPLPEQVEYAVEVLAMDENRFWFRPHLWSDTIVGEDEIQSSFALRPKRLQQIWMPGGHSDIGDRSSRSMIVDLSFLTMMERIQRVTNLRVDLEYTNDVFERILHSERQLLVRCRRVPFTYWRRSIPRNPCTEIHPLFDEMNGRKIGSRKQSWHYKTFAKVTTADYQKSIYTFSLSALLNGSRKNPEEDLTTAVRNAISDVTN